MPANSFCVTIKIKRKWRRSREHAGDLVGLVNSSNVVPEKDGKEKDPEKEDPEEEDRLKDKRESEGRLQ